MLAIDAPKPPKGDHFDAEVKFDGFRCGAIIEAGQLKLVSRQGTNVTGWFPELAKMPSHVTGSDVILDGEVVAGNGSVESFNILLRRARLRGRSTRNALPVSFVAFDLLWYEGTDWTQRPLDERRSQLRAIVSETDRLAVSRVYADGPALLAIASTDSKGSSLKIGVRFTSWAVARVHGSKPKCLEHHRAMNGMPNAYSNRDCRSSILR